MDHLAGSLRSGFALAKAKPEQYRKDYCATMHFFEGFCELLTPSWVACLKGVQVKPRRRELDAHTSHCPSSCEGQMPRAKEGGKWEALAMEGS